MTTAERANTLFVGVDVHKDTHTAVGVSPFGEKLFEFHMGNENHDFERFVTRVREVQGHMSPRFGLEDCQGYGARLARFLTAEGHPVTYVHPVLVDRERIRSTHPEKSDALDAYGVAQVLIRKIDELPVYTLTSRASLAREINEISLDREALVHEQTQLKNRLHELLHRIHNSGYASRYRDPFCLAALRGWMRSYPKTTDSLLVRSMKRKVARLITIRSEIMEMERELDELVDRSGYKVRTIPGCGVVHAAKLIGEIGDIDRFRSPAALAKYAGCAPRQFSSGKTFRHHKTRAGNRRLNCVLHRIALAQISPSGTPIAKRYFAKKVSEGKSKNQALTCLRRHVATVVWCVMKRDMEFRVPDLKVGA
jgi:transposase